MQKYWKEKNKKDEMARRHNVTAIYSVNINVMK